MIAIPIRNDLWLNLQHTGQDVNNHDPEKKNTPMVQQTNRKQSSSSYSIVQKTLLYIDSGNLYKTAFAPNIDIQTSKFYMLLRTNFHR